jgi:hypothetical protein
MIIDAKEDRALNDSRFCADHLSTATAWKRSARTLSRRTLQHLSRPGSRGGFAPVAK